MIDRTIDPPPAFHGWLRARAFSVVADEILAVLRHEFTTAEQIVSSLVADERERIAAAERARWAAVLDAEVAEMRRTADACNDSLRALAMEGRANAIERMAHRIRTNQGPA